MPYVPAEIQSLPEVTKHSRHLSRTEFDSLGIDYPSVPQPVEQDGGNLVFGVRPELKQLRVAVAKVGLEPRQKSISEI